MTVDPSTSFIELLAKVLRLPGFAKNPSVDITIVLENGAVATVKLAVVDIKYPDSKSLN